MEKIELTADEIKVIKQQLNGEIEVWNADDYQQKHLTYGTKFKWNTWRTATG